ncbi:MAG: hypothetical protein F4X64_07835 [Chloroflexi bacterium]|nr:hypothetical protein [Chloroflexota bacterium]
MTVNHKTAGIPVHYYTRSERLVECRKELKEYEQRYELSSEKMAYLVDNDKVKPGIEIIKWYHLYDELEFLLEMTPTTGIRGTTTKFFTKPDSVNILS